MTRLVYGAATHLGLVRRQNEDSFVATDGLWAVCDGMGGARAGEVASEVACRHLIGLRSEAGEDELRRVVDEANAEIRSRSLSDRDLAGMGTTLTAASAAGSVLTLVQVGDSRAYLYSKEGGLQQVTEDHSLVAEMIKRGQLTPEQASVHPHRSIITRALGTESSVTPDLFRLALEPGDRVLLCSDGLSGMVPENEMARLLARGTEPQATADALVAAALRHGGEDNVTAVVVFAVEGGYGSPGAQGTAGASSAAEAAADDTVEVVAVDVEERNPAAPASAAAGETGVAGADPLADREGLPTPGAGLDEAPPAPHPGLPGPAAVPPPPAVGAGPDGFGPVARGLPSPKAEGRGLRRRFALAGGAGLLVLALGVGGFSVFNSTVYFVGTNEGRVALFRGMPYAVVGVELYTVVEEVPTRFETLEPHLQARVDAHELVTKDEGLRFIRGLDSER